MASHSKYIKEEVKEHILFAQYYALEMSSTSRARAHVQEHSEGSDDEGNNESIHTRKLREEGLSHLEKADGIYEDAGPGTRGAVLTGLPEESKSTRLMLTGSFCEAVSNDEEKDILAAMAKELQSTGRW
jgi:hypothetical protein